MDAIPLHVPSALAAGAPLPEWLPPMTLHLQDWMLVGSTFGSSRRLEAPIVE